MWELASSVGTAGPRHCLYLSVDLDFNFSKHGVDKFMHNEVSSGHVVNKAFLSRKQCDCCISSCFN